MKPEYLLTINREGKFAADPIDQSTSNQCGKVGQQEYGYFCSITASSKSLTKEGYVMENLWTDEYFQKRYGKHGDLQEGIPSCEIMAMDAIDHFRKLFNTHKELKRVDLRRIYIRIHGSPVSYIEAEWSKKKVI